MSFKRLFLISFILANFVGANEEIHKSFFEKDRSLSQCTFYHPALSELEKMDIQSKKISITKESIFLEDDVVLKFDGGMLTSSSADLKDNSNLIDFNSTAEIFFQDLYLEAQRGKFNRRDNAFELYSGSSYWKKPNLFISFDTAQGAGDQVVFENASLTSCSNSSSGWALKAEEIIINEKIAKGSAKKIKLEIFDRTVFRFPYLPIYLSEDLENNPKRHSRFLDPSISYSSDGFDFTLPYQKIFSEKSDMTFGPRSIANRGNGFELNMSLNNDLNILEADFIYLNSDKEFDKRYPENPSVGDMRWGYRIQSASNLKFGILKIDWSDLSDFHFFRDVPGESVGLNLQREEYVEQSISFAGKFGMLSYDLGIIGFETSNPILTNGYRKKPYIDLSFNKAFGGFEFNSFLKIAEFSADKIHDFIGYEIHDGKFLRLIENPSEGSRIFLNNSIHHKKFFKSLEIDTSLGIKSLKYNLEDSSDITNDVSVPSINIKISSNLYKQSSDSSSYLSPIYVFGYSQTKKQQLINPVFDTSLVPDGVSSLNSMRFAGYDRIEDDKFHAIGLRFSKEKEGIEKISLSVKKKFLIKDREIFINRPIPSQDGPISSSFTWQPIKSSKFVSYLNYTEDTSKINNMGVKFLYATERVKLGIGQKFRRQNSSLQDDLYLTEFYLDMPLSKGYSIFAMGQRDNETDKFLEARLGFGYENCCFAAALTASKRTLIRFNDINISNNMFLNELWDNIIESENKSRINISFQLKGFNNNNKSFKKYIQNSILN